MIHIVLNNLYTAKQQWMSISVSSNHRPEHRFHDGSPLGVVGCSASSATLDVVSRLCGKRRIGVGSTSLGLGTAKRLRPAKKSGIQFFLLYGQTVRKFGNIFIQ